MSQTNPSTIAKRAFYEAMKSCGESEAMWIAAADAVVEECAKVVDIYADTTPTEGDIAPLIATVMSDTGRKIAEAIRALKTPPAAEATPGETA